MRLLCEGALGGAVACDQAAETRREAGVPPSVPVESMTEPPCEADEEIDDLDLAETSQREKCGMRRKHLWMRRMAPAAVDTSASVAHLAMPRVLDRRFRISRQSMRSNPLGNAE